MRGTAIHTAAVAGVAACLAVATLASAGCVGEAARAKALSDGPVAVVLVQTKSGSELDVVDLPKMQLVERVKLRSLCLEMDADERSRTVVTAQCGGPDRSADDAAGIYRLGERKVRYVELGTPNPLDVSVAGDVALLVHGFERNGRLVTTRVDVKSRRVLGHETLGAGALAPRTWLGGFAVPEIDIAGGPAACDLVAIGRDGRSRAFDSLDAQWAALVAPEARAEGFLRMIVRRGTARGDASWALALVGPNGVESETPLQALRHGVADACMWRGRLVVADADGIDMTDPGDTIQILDPATGEQVRALRIPGGMPAAIASWQEGLLVADGVSGDLLEYSPDGQLRSRMRLGGSPVGSAGLVVVP